MGISQQYQVIATGDIKPGFDSDEVKLAFAALFNTTAELAQSYLNKHSKVIKQSLDLDTAQKYQTALEKIGVDVCLQCEEAADNANSPSAFTLVPIGNENDSSEDAQTICCPKCYAEQEKSIECKSCGIFFEKYQSVQFAKQHTCS